MAYLSLSVVLWLVYVAFTQNLAPNNLVFGLLIGLGVSALARSISGKPESSRPELHTPPTRFQPVKLAIAIGALVLYIYRLLIDIVKCGITVSRYILDPKLPIRPGIIAVPAQTSNQKIIAISAHGITVTPGEMVVEIGDDGVMYTHCIDVMTSGDVSDKAQTARKELLEKIFQS